MKLFVVTGEASGDLHAAHVVDELRGMIPSLEVTGVGGEHLAASGAHLIQRIEPMSVVGLFNVLRHLPMFRRIFRKVVSAIESCQPDAVMLVDFPDFNLRIARECRRMGIRVIYYISPQVWAWRRGRVAQIRRNVDLMLVLFPFEETFYRDHHVASHYVGHPLLDQLKYVRRTGETMDGSGPLRILLLPGSRRSEVNSLLPSMIDAVELLSTKRKVDVTLLKAPTIDRDELQRHLVDRSIPLRIVEGDTAARMAEADIAIAASGTATLECAIIGLPVIVLYKLGRMTYELAKRLVKIDSYSLVNIVARRRLVPELIQSEVDASRIAGEVEAMVEPAQYERTLAGLHEVREALGEPGGSRRAAEKIATLLKADSTATR